MGFNEEPFSDCNYERENAYTACVYDLCFTPKSEWDDLLCGLLNDFAESCDAVGFGINRWRNESFCPYKCPVDNMIYNYDSTTCVNTTNNCQENFSSSNCFPTER